MATKQKFEQIKEKKCGFQCHHKVISEVEKLTPQ